MNLSENLSNSFQFAKKLLGDGGRLIILIVLDIIPVVNWIVIGYAARVLKESPSIGIPPKLEKYGEMFVDGAKVAFASLIYMLVPAIMIAAGASSLFAGILSMQGVVTPSVMLGGTGVILLLVGVFLGIFLLFLLAAGMAHMLKTGKFGKAFAFGEITAIIRRVGWGKYLVWIVVLLLISVVLGGAAGLIPYVGWVISAIISPILSVFIFRSLGLLYNDGAPPELQVKSSAPVAEIRLVCSSCGAPLQPQHKFCPTCGAPAPTPPPPTTQLESQKFCVNCGVKIPASAKFCGTCGTKQP
jgi:RNA polymerase subunit RPABC4/transcription elongation factor Spt4